MNATITARQNMPDTAKLAADLCEKFGFKVKFDYEYPTPADASKRVQIRDEKHNAPASEVTKYAAAMKRGEKFSPVIMTRDNYVADGNTRAHAAAKNKYPTIQALILDDDYEGANENTRVRLAALGAAFNVRNGKGIDRNEIRNAVEFIGNNPSYDATRIAALIGLTELAVRGILAEKRVRERAKKMDIHLNGNLGAGQLRKIGSADKGLNDAPFKELLLLTDDADLSPGEIAALIRDLKAAKSDDAALTILETEREARRQQIAERKATGKPGKPAAPAKLRQSLGFLLGYKGKQLILEEMVEHNPNTRKEHLNQIEDASLLLAQLIELQREYNARA